MNTTEYNRQYRAYAAPVSETHLKPFLSAMLTILFLFLAPLELLMFLFGELHISFFLFLMTASTVYLLIKINTDKDGYF